MQNFLPADFFPSESELAHPDGGEVGPGADFGEVGVRAKT